MKKLIFPLIVFAFVLSSCQQDPDITLPEEFSKKLVMQVGLDTTKPSGQDTASKIIFTYDELGRLKMRAVYEYSSPGTVYSWMTETRIYNGSENVPSRVALAGSNDGVNMIRDTSYLTYQEGKIVVDSVRIYQNDSWNGTEVSKYSPVSSGKCRMQQITIIPTLEPDTIYLVSEFSLVNKNLVSGTDSIYNSSFGEGQAVKYRFEYDSKINPLAAFTLPYLAPSPGYYRGYEHQRYEGANNPTLFTFDLDNEVHTNTYTYRPDNYPLSWVYDDSQIKILYIYKD